MLEDLTSFSFSKLRHCVSGGEPLNEEVIIEWKDSTGLLIKEGYGQTETTLLSGYFKGTNKVVAYAHLQQGFLTASIIYRG